MTHTHKNIHTHVHIYTHIYPRLRLLRIQLGPRLAGVHYNVSCPLWQKRPIIWQKRPIIWQKRPIILAGVHYTMSSSCCIVL